MRFRAICNFALIVRRSMQTHKITLPQGTIQGVTRKTIYEQEYCSFEGIPFAKPPLGELRFKAPHPIDPWVGVRDCTQFDRKPMQKNSSGTVDGNEDCLYLNVYSKKLVSETPLPVMVWIFGHGFQQGVATRDLIGPDYLMATDIVLVTINYRVCSLGFLSLRDPTLEVPGNAGLKDQVMALKWVKEHISHFNGDSNNITVAGESAGAVCAHYMTATEQTRGLFHKAIMMSGCMLNQWAEGPPGHFAYRLAQSYGYKGKNIDKTILQFLRKLEPNQLVDHELLTERERRTGRLFSFLPTVEPYIGDDCVISKAPLETMKTAWGNDIPIMIGGTSFEGLFTYPLLKKFPQDMDAIKNNIKDLLPPAVRASHTDEENSRLSQLLIDVHFFGQEPTSDALFNFLDLSSIKYFWHGLHRTVLARLMYSKAPTYLYRFDFDSPNFNHYRKLFCGKDSVRGASHADDLGFLFFYQSSSKLQSNSAEYKTIERMVDIWTAFVKNSDPNCAQMKPLIWKPVEKNDPNVVLNIGYDLEIMEIPERVLLDVWDSFYKRENLY